MRRPIALLMLAWIGVYCAQTDAAQVSLAPIKDNTIYEDSGDLSNGAGTHFFAGVTNRSDQRRRSLLQFDVSAAVPSGAMITSVSLSLTLSRSSSGPTTLSLHRLLSSWGEGASNAGDPGGGGSPALNNDATWQHRFYAGTPWTTPGGDFTASSSASFEASTVGSYLIASTPTFVSDVQSFLDSPSGNFGWMLKNADESLIGTAKRFESRESGVSTRPMLNITWLPAVLVGDANADNAVNTLDFNILAGNFGQSLGGSANGDFDNNGVVGSIDFDLLVANYGRVQGSPAPAIGVVVPEPASAAAILMLVGIMPRRQR